MKIRDNGLDLSPAALTRLVARCTDDVAAFDAVAPEPCALWDSDDVLRRVLDGSQRHSPAAAGAAEVWVGACHDFCAGTDRAGAGTGEQQVGDELAALRHAVQEAAGALLAALSAPPAPRTGATS